MRRLHSGASIIALACTVALAAGGPAQSAARHPRLVGKVGQDGAYTIVLTRATGSRVRVLPPGTYILEIHDYSSSHDYELDGPNGKSWAFTSAPFKGTKVLALKLVPGKYKAYCSLHESTMFQRFRVE